MSRNTFPLNRVILVGGVLCFALLGVLSLNINRRQEKTEWLVKSEEAVVVEQNSSVSNPSDITTGRKPKLADGCRHVYLDVGANVGVQVRKLFEPEKYPGATITQKYFDRLFGDAQARKNTGTVCAFTFEMNPEHIQKLRFMEACYNKIGWRTTAFVPRAVSNVDGQQLTVHRDNNDDTYTNLATTLFKNKKWLYKDERIVTVDSIDLGTFVMEEVVGRDIPPGSGLKPSVFAKIDIEGAEYMVIPGLLVKGAFCHIDEATLEWHPGFMEDAEDQRNANLVKTIVDSFTALSPKFVGCKPVTLHTFEDESHVTDGKPFPDQCGKYTGKH